MCVLQRNIEIVSGRKKHCLYNLNTGKMYSMDTEDLAILMSIIEKNEPMDIISKDAVGAYFLNEGIIVEKDNLLPTIKVDTFDPVIRFAWLEITQNCNLRCRHCYEESSDKNNSEISFENYKFAVDELKKSGVDRIQLIGGEPLIHSQIELLIDYAASRFSFIEIFTNGTVLTEKLLYLIKKNNIHLAFSIYSQTSVLHDKVTCKKGSFNLTFNNIQRANYMGIPLRLESVEMKDIPFFQFTDLNLPHHIDFPRLTGRADLSLYSRDMLKRKLITKESFEKPILPDVFHKNKALHNCFGEKIYIDCSLNAYPCTMERRVCYGNLREITIDEILHNEFLKMTKDHIDGCKECEYRYSCYDCRSDANNKKISAKPWYCSYDPENGEWIDRDIFIDTLIESKSS